jgi:hypothetical protein
MPPAPATPEPVAFFICGFTDAAVLEIYRPHKGGVMRQFPLWICLFFISVSFAFSQHQKPPGIVTADQQSNQPLEPPMQPHSRKVDVEQVKQEADELKKLADGVPAQIELLAKNQYPKDLNENLKRIEKLAKHLRSEITP